MQSNNIKIDDFRNKYFSLSAETQFRFNSLNYKVDGLIFVTSVLIVPMFISIVATLFFNLKNENSWFPFINILSIVIGLIFFIMRNPSGFFKNGYMWYYFLALGPQLVAIFVGLFVGFIKIENEDAFLSFLSIIVQLLTEIIIVALVFKYDRRILKRLKESFKTKGISLLVMAIIGLISLFLISTLFFSSLIEKTLMGVKESNNQESLIGILNGDYSAGIKTFYSILLFLLVIIVAPLCEEIAMRDSVFLNCSNKWLGFVTSSLLFGFIHYGATGDYGHFLSYTSSGVILSGVFLFTKGNLTYSWMVHLLNNILAFILMFIGVSW